MKLQTVLAAKGTGVVMVSPSSSIREAVATLRENNVGALIVVDGDGQPCGILSERDIIRALGSDTALLERRAGELMTAAVVCGCPQDDVEAVLKTMTGRHFRHLPVVEDGRLVGILTIGDLVKAQLNQYRGTVDSLQVQLMSTEAAAS